MTNERVTDLSVSIHVCSNPCASFMAMKAHNIFRNALQTSANQCRKHPCLVRADVQAMTIRPIADRSGMSPLDGSLYNFSRGRFVCNERQEMAQRYVRFDTEKLGAAAASAIGSASCVNLEKYPDGMYNRAMLLTMCDGKQAVAKIPNPNSGRPHLTTASEVATMDFVSATPHPFVLVNTLNWTDAQYPGNSCSESVRMVQRCARNSGRCRVYRHGKG